MLTISRHLFPRSHVTTEYITVIVTDEFINNREIGVYAELVEVMSICSFIFAMLMESINGRVLHTSLKLVYH